MEWNTGTEQVFDVGSLYAKFCRLSDKRKPKGLRYRLEIILVVMTLAKICGEDNPSGIADWAKHRAESLCDALKLERRSMPHNSTYRRISEEVICIEELEEAVSEVLSGKRYFGKQVLFEVAHTLNKGYGRIEQRTLTVSSQLKDFLDWPYLEQVFKLERRFTFIKTGKVQEQIVYGINQPIQR